jgi:hypothetical protein
MSSVFVVSRITNIYGAPDYEALAAFSTYDEATEQAKIYRTLYSVEVSELELDVKTMVPKDTVTVAGSE